MNPEIQQVGRDHILYDADRMDQIGPRWFDAAYWQERDAVEGTAAGRGTALFVSDGGVDLVLRHYHRGGLPARFSRDRYLWHGLERSRAFREWNLLARLSSEGLPVPEPVAARVHHTGLCYTADIITRRIAGRPLADLASEQALPDDMWRSIGATIRRFHDAGVFHADLNANNILIDGSHRVWLIDLDRGDVRSAGGWQERNLARLHRSLTKLSRKRPLLAFGELEWWRLLEGYG